MAARSYFFTGTDTGIGKTHVACDWIRRQRELGLRVSPMKPVSAGCTLGPDGLRNEDAELLLAASGMDLPYERVNRYAFEPAIAPHIAAQEAGTKIEIDSLVQDFRWLEAQADLVCVEGAGGWCVPLGPKLDTADLARALDIPVILVVGIRLGCLNHARLTERAILADGLQLAGWVANFCDANAERAEENCRSLEQRLSSPLLWRQNHAN